MPPSSPVQLTGSGSTGPAATSAPEPPEARTRRALGPSRIGPRRPDGGVTPPERMAAIPAAAPVEERGASPCRIERASPPSGATTSRPKPPSLRQKASADPSGPRRRTAGPPPRSARRARPARRAAAWRSSPSGPPTQTFIQPVASHTKARALAGRGEAGLAHGRRRRRRPRRPGRAGRRQPSTARRTIREASQGMSGKSHSCQASGRPSGDQAGSKAQSAPVESRAGQADPSAGRRRCRSGRPVRGRRRPARRPGDAAGAAASPSVREHPQGPAGGRHGHQPPVGGRVDECRRHRPRRTRRPADAGRRR